jgi:hypothetical protein
MIESIDAASEVQSSFAALGMTGQRERALTVRRTVIEKSSSPDVPHTDKGSFDYVRRTPHFAQDDRSNEAVASPPQGMKA